MNELLFSAMDIPKEIQKLLDTVEESMCNGMTDSERKAYHCGVSNALSAARGLLELDEEPAVHVPGLDGLTEMDIEELEEIFLR